MPETGALRGKGSAIEVNSSRYRICWHNPDRLSFLRPEIARQLLAGGNLVRRQGAFQNRKGRLRISVLLIRRKGPPLVSLKVIRAHAFAIGIAQTEIVLGLGVILFR